MTDFSIDVEGALREIATELGIEEEALHAARKAPPEPLRWSMPIRCPPPARRLGTLSVVAAVLGNVGLLLAWGAGERSTDRETEFRAFGERLVAAGEARDSALFASLAAPSYRFDGLHSDDVVTAMLLTDLEAAEEVSVELEQVDVAVGSSIGRMDATVRLVARVGDTPRCYRADVDAGARRDDTVWLLEELRLRDLRRSVF